MNYLVAILVNSIVVIVTAVIGYAIGRGGKVSEKTCEERRNNIHKQLEIKIDNLTNSIEGLKKEVKKDR